MSWKPNSDQDIENEYNWEYKRHWHHTGLFPTKQHFNDSVKNAEIVEITPEIDQHIGNRSHTKSIDDLKDLVSGYNYPRDVDSIVDGLHSGSPLPHPIVIKHNGNMSILSGNTRMDQAFIHGINPQVALIDLDRPSDSLEKMSQPKIRFPNFPKVSTRPDQDVQVMTTPRQKKLFGRKVAQARNRDKVVPYTQMDQNLKVVSEGTKLMSQQATRDKEAKYLEGLFSRNTLGLNAQVQPQKRSYAAAVGGQLQSKFEAPDDEHKEKMDAHREKRNQVVEDYNKRYMDWRYKADELSRKITNPKDENDPGRKAYFEHMLQKPTKPKLPRQPSRKKVSTEDLSPAAQQIRGKQTDATVEHEALHNLMDQVEHHYGRQAARKIQGKLLEQFDMNALSKVGMFIADRMGYKPKSDHFNEEILAHARDILVNPRKREAFEKYAGQDARQHINSLKAGYKKALKWTKKVRPEDVGIQSEPISEESGKIAQSRPIKE